MKIPVTYTSADNYKKMYHNLIKGEAPKLAANQTDKVTDVNFIGVKENHRVSFKYIKELDKNVAHIIDNSTGETVKKAFSDAEIDKMIRIERLKGIYLDEEG